MIATTKAPKPIQPTDTVLNAAVLCGAGAWAGGVEIEGENTGGTTGETDGEMSGGSTGDRGGSTWGDGTGDATATAGTGDGVGTEGGFATGECRLLWPCAWEITDPKNNDVSIRTRRVL